MYTIKESWCQIEKFPKENDIEFRENKQIENEHFIIFASEAIGIDDVLCMHEIFVKSIEKKSFSVRQ